MDKAQEEEAALKAWDEDVTQAVGTSTGASTTTGSTGQYRRRSQAPKEALKQTESPFVASSVTRTPVRNAGNLVKNIGVRLLYRIGILIAALVFTAIPLGIDFAVIGEHPKGQLSFLAILVGFLDSLWGLAGVCFVLAALANLLTGFWDDRNP